MQANHDLACIQDTACILETNSVSSTKKLRPQSSIWGPTSVQGPALCYNRYWCMIIPMCRVDPRCVHTERFSGVWRKLSALLQHGAATSDCWNRSQNSRTSIVQHSFNDSAFCDLQECYSCRKLWHVTTAISVAFSSQVLLSPLVLNRKFGVKWHMFLTGRMPLLSPRKHRTLTLTSGLASFFPVCQIRYAISPAPVPLDYDVHGVLMYAYSFHLRPVCTFLLCLCISVGVHLAVMVSWVHR